MTCVYTRIDERGIDVVFVILYVDDLLIIGAKLRTAEDGKRKTVMVFQDDLLR